MPTFVIDSAALSRNIEKLRRFTSAQIIAVVKGNGYGLGLVPYARFLTAQGVALLAVSRWRRPPLCGTPVSRRSS